LWVMTLLIVALVVFLVGFSLTTGNAFQQLTGIIIAAILCVSVLFSPGCFYVTDDSVIVKRPGPDVVIRISDIEEIRRIRLREFGFCIRTFGVGGFFGYYGKFYSFRIGRFNAYATNPKSLVLIICNDGKKYVLSPEGVDEFVEMVKQIIETDNETAL